MSENQRRKKPINTSPLLSWILFSVLMGSAPVFIKYLFNVLSGTETLSSCIANGDLLLVSAVLCGAAIGMLFGTGSLYPKGKMSIGFCCVIVVMLACWAFVASATLPTPAKLWIVISTYVFGTSTSTLAALIASLS